MTRSEALALLTDEEGELDFDEVDEMMRAYGFFSATPTHDIEVYYHPTWRHCGRFTARDDGLHLVSPMQRGIIRAMIGCVTWHETHGK